MTKNYCLNPVILCGLLALAPAAQAATFSITTFDCPMAGGTVANSINDAGQVTGYCNTPAGVQSFVKNGATVTTFAASTPSTFNNGMSINASGQVAGYTISNGNDTGFVYTNGAVTLFSVQTINNSPTNYIVPRSINAGGKVTGEYQDVIDPTHGVFRGFIYDSTTNTSTTFNAPNAVSTIPVGINDSGQVIGLSDMTHGFLYSAGAFTTFDAPNASQTWPWSINNSGQVAGYYWDINNVEHGFVYSNGALTPFDVAGATATEALDINDSGQVTGDYTDASGVIHGYVKTGATVTTIDVPGATITWPNSINTSGQVAGFYADAFGTYHGFVTTAITGTVTPPPTTACAKPKGAKSAAGKGTVTEVGTNYVIVVNLRIDYANCTKMNYGGNAKAPVVNDRIEWEGYDEPNGNVMGKTLSFN